MNTAIRPESVLRDLQRQWEELAALEPHDPDKAAGVLRACAMTLIVACRTSASPPSGPTDTAHSVTAAPPRSGCCTR